MADETLLREIKALVENGQADDRTWRHAVLERLDLVNGTVKVHSTAIALLEQAAKRQGSDLEEVCKQVRAVELSQAKAATIGAVVGAAIAVMPQLIPVLRAVLK